MREQAQAEAARIVEHGTDADRGGASAGGSPPCVPRSAPLATGLAGRIVGESLDDEARQSRVVERFLAELESDGSTTTGSGVN